MEMNDQEILKLKREMEESKKQLESKENMEEEAKESIYDEVVHILGKEVSFQRREVPQLGVSIYMPEAFFELAEDVKKIIYPAGNTPQFVFASDDINFHLSLSQTEHKVPDGEMKKFVKISADLLTAMGPKVTIVEKEVIEKDDFHIGTMAFVSRAVDMMVYNLQFYLSIEGQLLIGNINFPSKFKKRMIPIAQEIIKSIEIGESVENGVDHI